MKEDGTHFHGIFPITGGTPPPLLVNTSHLIFLFSSSLIGKISKGGVWGDGDADGDKHLSDIEALRQR